MNITNQLSDINNPLVKMQKMNHEQVVFCYDSETGLRAIIAIHNTALGPALGGTRMWNYENEDKALEDVLRLSRGMTLKAAISGLQLGGGKAVIIGDANTEKTEAMMRRFGKFVDSLAGRYITAKDVGIKTEDMRHVSAETKHVTGIPMDMGGSGDPSPVTAYGVYWGMKAAAKFKWGSDNLSGKKVLVQGVGNVGEYLVEYLINEGASVVINDIDEGRLEKVSKLYDVDVFSSQDLYDFPMHIYAPCALGATINPETISRLKCDIIAGGANNQLANEFRDADLLRKKDILYAPDFLINAGGLINVYSEIKGYDRDQALEKTKKIYDTTLEILQKATIDGLTTHEAALVVAQQRVGIKS